MRATWYERNGKAADVLVVGEMAIPMPGPDEVRVRQSYSGVNPGDIKKREGWTGSAMPFPRVVPHSDGAGVIEAVGERVTSARVGERVWVYGAQSYRPFGTAAEYVVVPSDRAVALASGVDLKVGACLGIAARTAHRCVFADGPVAGRTVLVQGGGGNVGLAAVALAAWGGARVIATVGASSDVELVRDAGATAVVPRHHDDLAERIVAANDGNEVDRIIEVAFGANIGLDEEVIVNGGMIVAYASDTDAQSRIPFWSLLFKNVVIRLVGSDDLPNTAEQQAVTDISAALAAGYRLSVVGAIFPLDRVAEAHHLVELGHSRGHVLIEMDGGRQAV